MRTVLLFALFLLAAVARCADAATTVTDCAAPPVTTLNGTTVLVLPGEDVILRCAFTELPGTDRVQIVAGSITVDGAQGGSLRATGKTVAVELVAKRVVIAGATFEATNTNGHLEVHAEDAVEVTSPSTLRAGDKLTVECASPTCTIALAGIEAAAHELRVQANGTITVRPPSSFETHGPIDLLSMRSLHGDVVFAGALPLPIAVPGVGKAARAVAEARAVCRCVEGEESGPHKLHTGVEGRLVIAAPEGRVVLDGVEAHAGESIDLTAATSISMRAATIDNCGPKNGSFIASAMTCMVDGAKLRDDEPDDHPTLACSVTGAAAVFGTCSAR